MKKLYTCLTHLATCFFVIACTPLVADIPQAFLEKEQEIRKDLYKISASDLQDFLGQQFEKTPTIHAEMLKEKMKEDQNLCVINVLPASLHEDCHITGSINVPLKELVETMASWDRDKEIIVYCALYECDAGEKAYILLSCMGFTNVTDYAGGIKEWYQLGYPTQGPASYSFLHTKSAAFPKGVFVCSSQFE